MSVLTDILNDKWRKRLYASYAGVGVAIGATQVGFQAAGEDQPKALLVTLAVYAYLGIALGLTAASNTPAPPDGTEPPPPPGPMA